MEDKQLTSQESLDLISKMINNTRRNFNDKGGSMFLIWGYSTIVVTLIVYFAFRATQNYDTMWLWWALPVIGGIFTWFHFRRNRTPVRTYMDKVINYVWIIFSVACMSCVLFSFGANMIAGKVYFNILFTITLLMASATALTGLMIKFPPVTIGGILGIVLSFLLLIFRGTEQFLIFGGVFLLGQVIPGHILNRACKKGFDE